MHKAIKVMLCVILTLSLFISMPVRAVEDTRLPLDLRDHWASAYAITLLEQGLMTGMPNGRFYPDRILSREEGASLLYRLLKAQFPEALPVCRQEDAPYTDYAGRWSEAAISALWAAGILDSGEAFSPDQPLTRADMAVYLARTIELCNTFDSSMPVTTPAPVPNMTPIPAPTPAPEAERSAAPEPESSTTPEPEAEPSTVPAMDAAKDPMQEVPPSAEPPQIPVPEMSLAQVRQCLEAGVPCPFPDIAGTETAPYAQYLAQTGILTGDSEGNFHPEVLLSRGEGAALIVRAGGYALSTTTFPPLPTYRIIDVPYISQLHPVLAPVGCEPTSLLMALQAKGYAQDVTLRDFLDNMPKTSSNPAKGFVGSPYVSDPTKRTRTTIYPPILTEYGCLYGNVIDLSGASVQELQREICSGNPIVAYVTLFWEAPFYRSYDIEGETQRLISNNHALLVCGFDAETYQYYIADPYNIDNTREAYFYWIDGALFDSIYNERHHALTVD